VEEDVGGAQEQPPPCIITYLFCWYFFVLRLLCVCICVCISFISYDSHHNLVFVVFFSCQRLEPVWKKTWEALKSKAPPDTITYICCCTFFILRLFFACLCVHLSHIIQHTPQIGIFFFFPLARGWSPCGRKRGRRSRANPTRPSCVWAASTALPMTRAPSAKSTTFTRFLQSGSIGKSTIYTYMHTFLYIYFFIYLSIYLFIGLTRTAQSTKSTRSTRFLQSGSIGKSTIYTDMHAYLSIYLSIYLYLSISG